MNNKGVTLVQVLLVIVVMGVIATFAVPMIGNVVHNSQVKVDSSNVDSLNYQTQKYAEYNSIEIENVFDGVATDEQKMNFLVEEGMLMHVVNPQQSGASFTWNEDTSLWLLVGGEYNGTFNPGGNSYTFSSNNKTIEELEDAGVRSINFDRWETTSEGLENSTGETRMFIPISNSTSYTITASAALSEGTHGGYGVFFDTYLDNDNVNRDNGYIFQFDRGYSHGAMIVRPRSNGRESGPVWVLHARDTDAFPSKFEDAAWWTASHTIRIVVSDSGSNQRNAEFFIDGQKVGEMTYNKAIDGHQIYTGFRGWHSSPTTFYNISS